MVLIARISYMCMCTRILPTLEISSMAILFSVYSIIILLIPFTLSYNAGTATADSSVVAVDSSGDFLTIAEAIRAAPNNSPHRHTIYIKKGQYKENLHIGSEKSNLTLIGEGIDVTIITGDRSGIGQDTSTLAVDGFGFLAVDLTVENVADPKNGPALAVRSSSPQAAFYRCAINGHQDTLFIQNGPQFFKRCRIYGTVDFIFGDGPAVFQSCNIVARQALVGQVNTLTANGRERPHQLAGFSFHLCSVTGDEELAKSKSPTRTYLGRPWRAYARTVFMESYITGIVDPEGWLRWNKSFEATLFYGEYGNSGRGAMTSNRVKWPGVHPVLDVAVAKGFTVSEFINGEEWLPAIGIPFVGGLISGVGA